MADDDLLMNFALGDDFIRTKSVFRGGRWKDRLSAKKSAEHRLKKLQAYGPSTGANAIPTPAKVPSVNESLLPNPPKKQKLTDRASHPKLSTNEIVSSLFTSNPSSKASLPAPPQNSLPTIPSNAPLLDSIHTFTTLGLSPVIASHLLHKLSLTSPTAIQKSAITQLLAEDSDGFIQAETGSGKTLAYLLPIIQRIMHLSSQPGTEQKTTSRQIHRTSGLFALILAPTRELCKQISIVLSSLLRCAHWIVAGTVIGGEKKKSEKARLRKGVNILVATPGRLADHLQNTEVLDVSRVRWLVLDEGDRLMELGFEEEIKSIVAKLDERRTRQVMRGLPERRTTVMCSATMKMTVQRLGEISLKDAVHIKVDEEAAETATSSERTKGEQREQKDFLAPAQLQQSYVVVSAKQRLVALAALLKSTFARKGSVMKAIVFLSCADSVDFHFEIFARGAESLTDMEESPSTKSPTEQSGATKTGQSPSKPSIESKSSASQLPSFSRTPTLTCSQNPHLSLYKLHGSLAQPLRTATLAAFTRSSNPCILLCTDVASRGLDLPNIDLVIEYDPPFSSDDHLHRVGRTARAGRDGRAMIFLMPGAEEGYVDVLKRGYRDGIGNRLRRNEAEDILRKGFGSINSTNQKESVGRNWEGNATEWQLDVERWVVGGKPVAEMARKAFISHVRAYATHVAKERNFFDVKGLHLGHLAKAFALRERPGNMGRGAGGIENAPRKGQKMKGNLVDAGKERAVEGRSLRIDLDGPSMGGQDAARKMRAKMKGHMATAEEFNIG